MSAGDSLIAAENGLSEEQRSLLRCLAGAIIPPGSEYSVPGADDDLIFADILATARPMAVAVSRTLEMVDEIARKRAGVALQSLQGVDLDNVLQTLRSTPAVFVLVSLVLRCYYRDDRVMRSLGMETRAPFPEGFEVEQGDWSLLDPVRSRGRLYREVP